MSKVISGTIFEVMNDWEIVIRKMPPAARLAAPCTVVTESRRRAAALLVGTRFGPSAWWYGEPELRDSKRPEGLSISSLFIIYPEVQ